MTAMFALFGLAACNTMEGFGEDIESGGDAIEDSASKHKNY
ncbi:MAG: entericidin A/B family lipoprotein [Alphaproteobacteria bacterium]|nr:entericidin A/B family lipoprotein [Alphaproteobacteria bacterium]